MWRLRVLPLDFSTVAADFLTKYWPWAILKSNLLPSAVDTARNKCKHNRFQETAGPECCMEDTHLVEHDAEEEEDNVEDLVDHHLVMWHTKDIEHKVFHYSQYAADANERHFSLNP